jgi:HlyD family secretion protein
MSAARRSSLKRTTAALAVIAAAASAGFLWSSRDAGVTVRADANKTPAATVVVFASLGRVEGLSETAQVGAASDGILKAIYVNEGQAVSKGTLLGDIGCDDLSPMLQAAVADAEAARQSKVRLLRGARDEERKVANRKTAAARATFAQARSNLERQRILFEGGQIARAAYDQAFRDWGVAQADFQAAARTEKLLAAPALPEETARADAEIAAAEAGAQAARERIKKCSIFAPMDGTVLRVYGRAGESFSTVTPRPLFAIADASGRRVKAEVDERDLGKVEMGQKVAVHADGFPGRTFTGTVASISAVIGSKKTLSDDPSDQVDRQVVEATVRLGDDAQLLPIGLRVTVQFFARQTQDRLTP